MVTAMSKMTRTQKGTMRNTILTSGRALLVALCSLTPLNAVAATRGPDAGGYTATDGTVYSFVDIAGANGAASILAGTDDGMAVLALPFAFGFYGVNYTQVCVSSNGALYFIASAAACNGFTDFANTDLTSTTVPGDLAAALPYWSDLSFQVSGAGAVYYQTIGAAGSRRFVIQWERAFPQDSSNPVTFQIVLSEGSGQILFQYKQADLGSSASSRGGQATVGIRNAGAPPNQQDIGWSFNAPVIANESAIMFSRATSQMPVITVTGGTFPYDGSPHPAVATASGPGGGAVAGSFAYSYAPGGGTAPVNAGTYSVLATFTSSDPGFTNATGTATIIVNKATPTITWANPAPIDEGTPLGATQLDATVNAPGSLVYNPPAGTILNDGVATLMVTFTPSDPVNYDAATKSVSLTVRPTAGVMNGVGRVDASGISYKFAFHVQEKVNGAERGSIALEVDRTSGNIRNRHIGTFTSTNVDPIVFSDNPAFRPGVFPRPTVDTATMSGTGRWNGVPGYKFTAEAIDAGEPGAGRDRFTMTIRSPQGAVVATVSGVIDAGNIQSSRLGR